MREDSQAVRQLTERDTSGKVVGREDDWEEIEFEDKFLKKAHEHGEEAPTPLQG